MALLILFLIIAALLFGYSANGRAVDRQRRAQFIARAEAAQEWINSIDTLPVIATPGTMLQKAEVCYWFGECAWDELRTRTKRVSYHGPSLSIPIAGGLRYRFGSVSPTFERTSELQSIDQGVLFITNKRMFFDGAAKNAGIPFKSVVRIALFDGGFEIEKQTGRSPHIRIAADPEKVAAVAVRAHLEWAEIANAD